MSFEKAVKPFTLRDPGTCTQHSMYFLVASRLIRLALRKNTEFILFHGEAGHEIIEGQGSIHGVNAYQTNPVSFAPENPVLGIHTSNYILEKPGINV